MKMKFGQTGNPAATARARKWMYIGVLAGVPLASFFLVFQPQNREIARAKTEIQLKLALLEKVREETARSDDLQRSNETIASAIKTIEAQLPSDKEMDLVLRDVAEIAKTAGLELPIFKRGEKALPAGQAMEQPLEVQVTGNFDGFYRFLVELERLPRIVRVPDIKLTRGEQGDGTLQADLTLSVYYLGTVSGAAK